MGPSVYTWLPWTVQRVILGILLVCLAFPAPRQTAVGEDEVRTAFLFQLAQYVHWPAEAFASDVAPLRFCLLGEDKLIPALKLTVRDKSIQGRPIAVLSVASAGEMTKCHVVFVTLRSEREIRAALASWEYPPVLMVGETDRFAEMGGMVNLVIQSGHVSFEINLATATRAHLELRSQLLRFARIVGGKQEERP